jgi:hypothetical protein
MANVPMTLKARNASNGWDVVYPKTTLAQIIGLISGDKMDPALIPPHFATCSTAAATVAKTADCAGFVLAAGVEVTVLFTVTNTAASPTLNINGTGAKAIYYRNAAISAGYLAANRVYSFVYDGTQWELIGDVNVDTTYSAMSVAEGTAATATNSRVMRADYLKQIIQAHAVSVGDDGKIDPLLIPQQAITDVFEASSDAEMIALSAAHAGDVCIRSDVSKTYILKAAPYSTLGNWVQLPIPQDLVLSVNSKTGAVTLGKGDVGLGNVDNTADSAKSVASAGKLAAASKISGVNFDGSADIVRYATCSTAAATAEKAVALAGFTLVTGAAVTVKFTVTNTAAGPTMNVNSTGAKPIYYRNAAISTGALAANRVYDFVFNGTQWDFVGDIDANTTYTAMTQTEAEAGTATTARVIAPNILKAGITALTTAVTAGTAEPASPKVGDIWLDYNNA